MVRARPPPAAAAARDEVHSAVTAASTARASGASAYRAPSAPTPPTKASTSPASSEPAGRARFPPTPLEERAAMEALIKGTDSSLEAARRFHTNQKLVQNDNPNPPPPPPHTQWRRLWRPLAGAPCGRRPRLLHHLSPRFSHAPVPPRRRRCARPSLALRRLRSLGSFGAAAPAVASRLLGELGGVGLGVASARARPRARARRHEQFFPSREPLGCAGALRPRVDGGGAAAKGLARPARPLVRLPARARHADERPPLPRADRPVGARRLAAQGERRGAQRAGGRAGGLGGSLASANAHFHLPSSLLPLPRRRPRRRSS